MEIKKVKDIQFTKKKTLKIFGKIIHLERPMVMGIVNVTDDSFYGGSRSSNLNVNLERINRMIEDKADIIDLGAASTRPGAELISYQAEKERLQEILLEIRRIYPLLPLSIDTYNSDTAQWAVEVHGINIINDISMGIFDENMFSTVAQLNVPYILMHNRSNPKEMAHQTTYRSVLKEVLLETSEKLYKLRKMGVSDIIIDPGFGFSKTLEQNYDLMQQLEFFHLLGAPVLIGVSRKSMIYKLLNGTPEESLNGSSILHSIALLRGADILRVHDVKQAVECIKICEQFSA